MISLRNAVLVLSALCSGVVFADDSLPLESKSALCVILIGGIDSDPSPQQIDGTAPRGTGQSGLFQLISDLPQQGLTTEYFNWNGTRAWQIKKKPPLSDGITQFIQNRHAVHPRDRLVIIANSWGGHTAWEVCDALNETSIPIEMALFLDPSSMGRAKTPRPTELPLCIKSARNYYTRNVFGWREWPNENRIVNIDLGDTKHGFLVPGGPKYDATFDTQAHISAEWDPRIHAEIKQHVLSLLKAEVSR